jgi:hypothetical protein
VGVKDVHGFAALPHILQFSSAFTDAKIALSRVSAFVTFGASKVKKRNVCFLRFVLLRNPSRFYAN